MEDAVIKIADFIYEYRILILVITIIIFLARFIHLINGLFDFFRNIKNLFISIFKTFFQLLKGIWRSFIFIFNIPINMYKRHKLKKTKFYVVPN